MKKEDLNNLGFGVDKEYSRADPAVGQKEIDGFIAGVSVSGGKTSVFSRDKSK